MIVVVIDPSNQLCHCSYEHECPLGFSGKCHKKTLNEKGFITIYAKTNTSKKYLGSCLTRFMASKFYKRTYKYLKRREEQRNKQN